MFEDFFMAFLMAFIPLFVAVDAVGVLPIYISLTEETGKKEKLRVLFVSMVTAIVISVAFLFLGKLLFGFLGITISDFMIAGGIILFAIALTDLITQKKMTRMPGEDFGAVPLGTPLIAGPAVLTTSLILNDQFGTVPTLIAIVVNVFLAGLIFYLADFVIKIMGQTGTRAMSKVSHLLLAAIAVMLVRKGIILSIGVIP
ncbi:MAG: MarC family protein [Spirochaetaceae bacterium]|nr:MAG: MarC family protein [Spirochaetaceae bacterium]